MADVPAFADLKFRPRGEWDSEGIAANATFENGYTVSVIRGLGTYGSERGLYEMAVMHGAEIVYDTPITDDVLGHLTEEDVSKHMAEVAALPVREPS